MRRLGGQREDRTAADSVGGNEDQWAVMFQFVSSNQQNVFTSNEHPPKPGRDEDFQVGVKSAFIGVMMPDGTENEFSLPRHCTRDQSQHECNAA